MGDVMAELHREGHIRPEQYIAVCRLLADMRAASGTSDGIVGQVAVRVQTSLRERHCPPGGGDLDAFARWSRVISGLREHERAVLCYLIRKGELPRGGLSDYGRLASAYRTNKTTRAFAVGKIGALAASIAELYGGPV